MDEDTEHLRDLFVETTGTETVTEEQDADRWAAGATEAALDEVRAVVARMRERYDFATDLDDAALARVARGVHAGESDAAIAEAVDADPETVVRARLDLHLVRESDRDAPFDLDAIRPLVADGADAARCAEAVGADPETVARYRAVVAADLEATRANERWRDAFADLLTDADLSARLATAAREDGLDAALDDLDPETDVSF